MNQLLQTVWTNPGDDAARAAVAEAFSAQGDPRGEFIALQLRAAQGELTLEEREREQELLRQHFSDWVGSLGPHLDKKACAFERGFLARCGLLTADAQTLAEFKELATVVELVAGRLPVAALEVLLEHPAFPSLRALDLDERALAALAVAKKAWRLDRLTVEVRGGAVQKVFTLLEKSRAFPRLEALGVRCAHIERGVALHSTQVLAGSALGKRLRRFSVQLAKSQDTLACWMAKLCEVMPPSLLEVTGAVASLDVKAKRSPAGVELSLGYRSGGAAAASFLGAWQGAKVISVRLVSGDRAGPTEPDVEVARAAVARLAPERVEADAAWGLGG